MNTIKSTPARISGLVTIGMMLISAVLSGQVAPETSVPSMPSPTVASLARYAEFPLIDQFGLASVNIPIYDVQVKDFTLPITLLYHSSGIRVAQQSSWVGLGFDLQAGGFITRSVRDLPDDMQVNRNLPGTPPHTYNGWLKDPDFYEDFPNLTWAQGSDEESKSGYVLSFNDGGPVAAERQDIEPDIFIISVGSVRERFVFNHSGQIVFLEPKTKLTVSYPTIDYSKGIREFVVKDSDGNQYFFGSETENNAEVEVTTVKNKYFGSLQLQNYGDGSMGYYWNDGETETRSFRTTWFLRKIEIRSNGEFINFTYISATEKFDVPIDQYYTKQDGSSDPLNPKPLLYMLWSGLKAIQHTTNTKYLSGISTNNISVAFQLGNRTDLEGGKKLDRITVTAFGKTLEDAQFGYSVVTASGTESSYLLNRMYLNSLTLTEKPPFIFTYYNQDLPDKKSSKQDLWGFPCDKSTSLIPKIYVYPSRTDYTRYSCFPVAVGGAAVILPGSDRTLDLTSVTKGSLKRIKYPTGGYDEFILEPNDFYDPNWGEIQGGGLRIQQIKKLNEVGVEVQRKTYTYRTGTQSSGTLVNGLAFAAPTTYSIPGSNPIMYFSNPNGWDYFTLRTSGNYFPLMREDGPLVAYTNVSMLETGNGKQENVYYPVKNFLANATSVKWAKQFVSTQLLNTNANSLVSTGQTLSIDLEKYGLDNDPDSDPNWVWVNVLEKIDGVRNWHFNGATTEPEFYFTYNYQNYKFRALDVSSSWYSPLTITQSSGEVPLGQIQKTGTNIFPYPPISDDGNVNAGKLKEVRKFSEGDLINPKEKLTYTYKAVGTATNIYGVVHQTDFVCNIILTPMPLERDWTALYSYNAQSFLQSNMQMYIMPKSWAKYKIIANQTYIVDVQSTMLDGVEKITQYNYNANLFVKESIVTSSLGNQLITKFKYSDDYPVNNINNGINKLKDMNVLSKYIEKEITSKRSGVSTISLAEYNDYKVVNGTHIVLSKIGAYKPALADATAMNSTINASGELVPDTRYRTLTTFDEFDTKGNATQFTGSDKITKSLIWGYNGTVPIAQVENAIRTKIAHTSFETNGDLGDFTYSATTAAYYSADAKTGTRSYYAYSSGATHTVSKSNHPVGNYIVSYWAKGNGAILVHTGSPVAVSADWKYYEKKIQLTVATTVTITGSGTSVLIDEVRLYPLNALMTTYTHDPYIGITTITDANGNVTYYQYNAGRRLELVQFSNEDGTKSILSQFIYRYMN